MKKKIFLFSSLVLASSTFGLSVSADETTPTTTPVGDTTLPVPSTDTGTINPAPVDGGATTPVETPPVDDGTTAPIVETPPVDDGGTLPINGGTETPTTPVETPPVDGGTTTPTDEGTSSEGQEGNVDVNKDEDEPNKESEAPSNGSWSGKTQTVWSEGTVSPSTGQVVSSVTPEQPIITDKGYEIVSTNQGRVVIAEPNGTTREVEPEEVGAKRNEDGTISVKDSNGEMKTLPETGAETSIFMTVFGSLLMIFGLNLVRKRNALTANLSNFSY
uniref:LPXTG cell wall anchor domain-containing protein n=1 Tax=Streptococcus pluranimalium TaxID=82348 RepID=UPI003F68F852